MANNNELTKKNKFLKSELDATVKYCMQSTEYITRKDIYDAYNKKRLAKVIKEVLKPKPTPHEDTKN